MIEYVDPLTDDEPEQPQEQEKPASRRAIGCLIVLLVIIGIPLIIYLGIVILMYFSDSTTKQYMDEFTTELGDTFEVYYVREEVFIKVHGFYELRQKGENDCLVKTGVALTNDDVKVIKDTKKLRAYLVCGTIIYSERGKDFRVMRKLSDVKGKLDDYVGENLLSSSSFMHNYFHDYVDKYPDDENIILDGYRAAKKHGDYEVLKKYGLSGDFSERKEIMDGLRRYFYPDDGSET